MEAPTSIEKKPWVKPELKRYVRVSLTGDVSLTGSKFDRLKYQREYMRKRRAKNI